MESKPENSVIRSSYLPIIKKMDNCGKNKWVLLDVPVEKLDENTNRSSSDNDDMKINKNQDEQSLNRGEKRKRMTLNHSVATSTQLRSPHFARSETSSKRLSPVKKTVLTINYHDNQEQEVNKPCLIDNTNKIATKIDRSQHSFVARTIKEKHCISFSAEEERLIYYSTKDSASFESRKENKKPSHYANRNRESHENVSFPNENSGSTNFRNLAENSDAKANIVVPDANTKKNEESNNRSNTFMTVFVRRIPENGILIVQYKESRSNGFMEEIPVETVVKLADHSGCDLEIAKRYKCAAMEIIEQVYAIACEALKKGQFSRISYKNLLSHLLTLCDSWSICQEFVKFFMSKLSSPDLMNNNKPKKMEEEKLTQLDHAYFVVSALLHTLRKYSKLREKKYCEMENTCRQTGEQLDTDFLNQDSRWSEILSIYAAENSVEYPILTEKVRESIELLKSWESPNK